MPVSECNFVKTLKVIAMKKVALILGFLVFSFGALAQESNVKQSDLKGPAYKNYKSWTHKTEPTKIYSENNKVALQGPAYKNAQLWRATSKENLVVVNTAANEKQKLSGPAYKNFGPWSKVAIKQNLSNEIAQTNPQTLVQD